MSGWYTLIIHYVIVKLSQMSGQGVYTDKKKEKKTEKKKLNLVKKVGNGHFGVGLDFNRYLSRTQLHSPDLFRQNSPASNIYVSIKKLFITVYF